MKLRYFFPLIATFVIILSSCNTNTTTTKKTSSCDKSSDDYKYGYDAGHGQAVMVTNGLGGTSDVDLYIERMNNGNGPIGTISDCWKEGFDEGYKSYTKK